MTVSVLRRPLYGQTQASELLDISPSAVDRWLNGYVRRGTAYPPIVRTEPGGPDDLVTWGEFVELRYLAEYRRRKVPLQQLRQVVDILREELGVPYPLAHARPFVANRELALAAQTAAGLDEAFGIVTIVRGQLMLTDEAQAFYDKVEFDEDTQLVTALRPAGRESAVLQEPLRAFGMPTVPGRNVRTEVLYEMWQAGDQPGDLADAYDLPLNVVNDALVYESRPKRARTSAA